jgi:hypothetical protein
MILRPARALSIASLIAGLALLGCGGSTKTSSSTSATHVASAPTSSSATSPATSSTPAATTPTSTGSSPSPKTQPSTATSTGSSTATSTLPSVKPGATKTKKTESTAAAALAACEHAIAQKTSISPALKAKAQQICRQVTGRVLSRSSGLEREVCERVVKASKANAEIKAQGLARCKQL